MRSVLILVSLIALIALGTTFAGQVELSAHGTSPMSHTIDTPVTADAAYDLAQRYPLLPHEVELAAKKQLMPAQTKTLLRVDAKLRPGDFRWNDDNVDPGPLEIWVDLQRQMISVYRGGHEIGTAVIVYGAENMSTPLGTFPILSKRENYHSRSYDAPMPYSLFLTKDGVALHASPISRRRATHGCIGLPTEFARLLFEAAKTDDPVYIVRSEQNVVGELIAAPLPDLN